MKAKVLLLMCVALVACLVTLGTASYQPNRTTWEYKILPDPHEAELNKLGAEGWELAGVKDYPYSLNGMAFLKRPK